MGISTDADAISVVAFANSRANLDRMVAEEPEFALDSTWHIGEWDLDAAGASPDPLEPVREELEQARPTAAGVFMPLDADVDEEQLAAWSAPLNNAPSVLELRTFLQLS